MKLLLTSGGIRNQSILNALVDLLGKPISEANALCIPTAGYAYSNGAERAWAFIAGKEPDGSEPQCPMVELGWKSISVLELTTLPSIGEKRWHPWVERADVFLVNGGDAAYLHYWIRQSGLADLFPSLSDKVWVGLSAGSMVMTPRIGQDFVGWTPPSGTDETLGLVDFSIFPHLEHPMLPWNTMANAEKWAAEIGGPCYAIDDDTAMKVVDGKLEIISEGRWRQLA